MYVHLYNIYVCICISFNYSIDKFNLYKHINTIHSIVNNFMNIKFHNQNKELNIYEKNIEKARIIFNVL